MIEFDTRSFERLVRSADSRKTQKLTQDSVVKSVRKFAKEIRAELPYDARRKKTKSGKHIRSSLRIRSAKFKDLPNRNARGATIAIDKKTAFHARFLEKGTKKMRRRPFFVRVLERYEKRIIEETKRQFNDLVIEGLKNGP